MLIIRSLAYSYPLVIQHLNGATTAPTRHLCRLCEGELPSNDPGRLCDVFQAIYLTLSEMWAGATNGEKAGIMGQSVRISFHDPAEFDRASNDNRGPDGCLCTSPGCGSEGLIEADSLIFTDQEPLWQLWCDVVGRADFWNMCVVWRFRADQASSVALSLAGSLPVSPVVAVCLGFAAARAPPR